MILFRWAFLVVLFSLCAALCPPNTFTCKDGSCIPEEWVGDGEPDCDDKSDEEGMTNNSTKEDDPFDEIITENPVTLNHSSKELLARVNSSDEECAYEHQLRIDECSEPILLFIHEVNDIYFENSSILADKQMQSRVEKGCNLMHEYSICIQGASEKCHPDEGVTAWQDVETYICQLLLPAVREHDACFGKGRHADCEARFDPLGSPFCRLITSVQQDVECVQRYSRDCSEVALEMLPPILEESQHISEAIRCRPLSTEKRPHIQTTTEPTEEESNEVRSTSSTTEEVPEPTEVQETRPLTTEETTQKMDSSTAAPTAEHETPKASGLPELRINMSDAVNSMYYIYDICSTDYMKSSFKLVAKKICEKQDEIAKHSDCFQTTLEKMKCATRDAKTDCQALEAFNSNLDCAITAMNDVCEVEAQNLVVDIQESINDVLIQEKCFDQDRKKAEETSKNETSKGDEFKLQSKLPKCEDEQENGALACLVELIEINKQLAQFQNLNFLLEIASPNSTVVSNICGLFSRYEKCLTVSVFKNGSRCSFASPLNTLARIGLAPICSLDSRPLLAKHRECLSRLAVESSPQTNCQSGLGNLGQSVNMMLNGIHGEALLCKTFYLIRNTFTCGEKAVQQSCDGAALADLGKLKAQMSSIGEEEGCPAIEPTNLDAIIAKPVVKPRPMVSPSTAPIARPLNVNGPPPPSPAPIPPRPSSQPPPCVPDQQKKFEECVRPLTAYQPHPLSVIKMPKQIDEACADFEKFKECSASVDCHPLWARGMTAMFEYACGEGSHTYKEVRQCIRKVSQDDLVRDCVTQFSRGAPTQACLSANRLLSCSLSTIQGECSVNASEWVSHYVTKFATAIDPRCKLASQLPIGKVVGVGCSPEEEAIIEHCAAPLNDIGSRMEEMFQGGLQAMIKNINGLAPVFAGGCNLTDEFRTCAAFLLSGRSPCVVSSCMIQAGNGICDQPDPAKAIDENLSCVFSQIQEPAFAKCIRSTLSTVKQFTLSSFRNVLPKFIDCTQDIVREKCGDTPMKVLRAMSSPDLCPVGSSPIVPVNTNPTKVEPQLPSCTAEKRSSFEKCTKPFFSKYRMFPVALINEVDNMNQVCSEVAAIESCSSSARICFSSEQMALKKTVQYICSTLTDFEEHKICLKTVATSAKGATCMSEFVSSAPMDRCVALNSTASCLAQQVQSSCGDSALQYAYKVMSDYATMYDSDCLITAPTLPSLDTSTTVSQQTAAPVEAPPTVSQTTVTSTVATTSESSEEQSVELPAGCSEKDMEAYYTCESKIDKYSFRPISMIGDASKLSAFCTTFSSEYKPCMEKLKCKFEPASSASVSLIDSLCNKPITNRDHISYGKCLADYTNSPGGRQCIQMIAEVDPLAKEAPILMCKTLNDILGCSGGDIESQCGFDALLHVYDLHIQWAQSYNTSCVIQSPQSKGVPANTLDFSRDSKPEEVVKDDTTPAAVTTTTQTVTTTHPKAVIVKGVAVSSMLPAILVLLFSLYFF